MPGVQVSLETIKAQIAIMEKTLQLVSANRRRILEQYKQLGTGWSDIKYRELGVIVNDSCSSLRRMEGILSVGIEEIKKIFSLASEYESVNLYGNVQNNIQQQNGAVSGCSRNITAEEERNMWQATLEHTDALIENYREGLMSRGVPDCQWLRSTLAQHRAAILEQEGYQLDAARGHSDTSLNNPNAYTHPGDYSAFFDSLANEFREHCLTQTNPNYNLSPEWNDNCQRCVPALEVNRRGNNVTARPSTYGSDHLAYHPYDVWENPEVISTTGSGIEDIQSTLSQWGDGARAQVVVYWAGPFGGGHTFIAEQINGETVFSDPQTGNTNVTSYFNRVIDNSTTFCRIDNLGFSDYINDCYMEV